MFTPKYRRKIIYNQYRESLKEIIKTLCGYKGVEILEGHLMPDHVHLLLSIPPSISISNFMGSLIFPFLSVCVLRHCFAVIPMQYLYRHRCRHTSRLLVYPKRVLPQLGPPTQRENWLLHQRVTPSKSLDALRMVNHQRICFFVCQKTSHTLVGFTPLKY